MKKLIILLTLAIAGTCLAAETPKTPPQTPEQQIAELTKERDALKVEVATLTKAIENTKKESQAFISSFQEQVQNLSNQLATSQTNLKLTGAALQEALIQKVK